MGNLSGEILGARHDNDNVEAAPRCPACGASGHRGRAHFCLTCGRELDDSAYLPSDTLRASYHNQQRPQTTLRDHMSKPVRNRGVSKSDKTINRNGASTTAIAFVTYSLVPYLGILFCPGAIVMGGIGLIRSVRVPNLGGRRSSYVGVVFGLVIFSAQVFLWWILYKVPQWATGVEF